MRRGDLYRVRKPSGVPKPARVYVVVSRDSFVDTPSSATVVCAPVYSARLGISTEVGVGPGEGLKHPSSVRCDLLVSVNKAALTDYVGELTPALVAKLNDALRIALELE